MLYLQLFVTVSFHVALSRNVLSDLQDIRAYLCNYTDARKQSMSLCFQWLISVLGFLIKHYSGLCLAIHNGTSQVYLKKSCNERFVWTSSDSIMHIRTKLCLVPTSPKDNAKIIAKDACNGSFSRFIVTRNQSLRHAATKKCIHPYWGCPVPLNGERMVLHNECDEERLTFHFEASELKLYYSV